MAAGRRGALALSLAVLVTAAVTCGLFWPLPLHLGERFAPSAFGAAHAWAADHIWQALSGDGDLHRTAAVGYPWIREARFINWLPSALSWPLRPLLGPLGAWQAVHLLSPALCTLAAWPLLRRWTDAGPWARAAACVTFGLSPFLLGTAAIGETPKLQAWCFPLFLLALDDALGQRPWRGAAGLALLGLATSLTSPYFGLALPLLAGAAALIGLLRRRWGRAALVLGVTAASLLPAYFYFQGSEQDLFGQIFQPALARPPEPRVPTPHPVATLYGLLVGDDQPWRGPWEGRHIYYLGTPLLLGLALAALVRRRAARGRVPALALLAGGALLAMGPRLALRHSYTAAPLPAALLEAVGYPYAAGGMYFRLVVLASLGLALWLAAEGARRPWLAIGLALVQVADAVRVSGPWPRPVEPVPALEVLESLRGLEGAVAWLPLQEGPSLVVGQRALLAATVHGRPTNALPRDLLRAEVPGSRRFWSSALLSARPAQALKARGVVAVIEDSGVPALPPELRPPWLSPPPDWTARLGEPSHESGGLRIWLYESTPPRPRPVRELRRRRPGSR